MHPKQTLPISRGLYPQTLGCAEELSPGSQGFERGGPGHILPLY